MSNAFKTFQLDSKREFLQKTCFCITIFVGKVFHKALYHTEYRKVRKMWFWTQGLILPLFAKVLGWVLVNDCNILSLETRPNMNVWVFQKYVDIKPYWKIICNHGKFIELKNNEFEWSLTYSDDIIIFGIGDEWTWKRITILICLIWVWIPAAWWMIRLKLILNMVLMNLTTIVTSTDPLAIHIRLTIGTISNQFILSLLLLLVLLLLMLLLMVMMHVWLINGTSRCNLTKFIYFWFLFEFFHPTRCWI